MNSIYLEKGELWNKSIFPVLINWKKKKIKVDTCKGSVE